MRVVVLGVSGRAGQGPFDELIARGHEPVVLLRGRPVSLLSPSRTVAMRGDVEVHLGDPRDTGDLRSGFVVDELECPRTIEAAPMAGSC